MAKPGDIVRIVTFASRTGELWVELTDKDEDGDWLFTPFHGFLTYPDGEDGYPDEDTRFLSDTDTWQVVTSPPDEIWALYAAWRLTCE